MTLESTATGATGTTFVTGPITEATDVTDSIVLVDGANDEHESNVAEGETSAPESEADEKNEDAVFYDVPRPFLTLKQAGQILGKSIRALERSISGRWGNKLPDGWQARKLTTARGEEWRIIPPPGFRVRQVAAPSTTYDTNAANRTEADGTQSPYSASFDIETYRRRLPWRPAPNAEQQTIVIDRSDEVEELLRELCATQKALSEERRAHLEDMRMVAQLQGSMRLLEANAGETRRVKDELSAAKEELEQLKANYNQLLNMSWWQRLFGNKP